MIKLVGKLATAGLAAGLVLGAVPAAVLADPSSSGAYLSGPIGDVGVDCTANSTNSAAPGIGGFCFSNLNPGGKMDITVADAAGGMVNAAYQFADAKGNPINQFVFCTSAKGISVPAGATTLYVFVQLTGIDESKLPPPASLTCGTPQPELSGTVTITGSGVTSAPVAGAGQKSPRKSTLTAYRATASRDAGSQSPRDVQSGSYVAGDTGASVGINAGPGVHVGGVGFAVNPGDTITISVVDQVKGAVNYGVAFRDAALRGKPVGTDQSICTGKPTTVTVPAGGVELFVTVAAVGITVGSTSVNCGSPNGATTGTVTVATAAPAAGPAPAPMGGVSQRVASPGSAQHLAAITASRFSRAFRQL